MLFRPLADPLPPALLEPGLESLTALEGLNGYDQLEITCRHVVGILRAYRSTFVGSQERRADFDVLCDGLVDWLEAEIAPLRFTRPN
jgi:hypothetical protein